MTETTPPPSSLASALPNVLPIFPLTGGLLLPRSRLPLNIFEPRYRAMIEDSLGQGRMIGIIQPTSTDPNTLAPPVYSIGCAGRIVSFTETDDGRFLINLYGVCRFLVKEELPQQRGYRRVRPDWQQFLTDLTPSDENIVDRNRLVNVLRHYFKAHDIAVDWAVLQGTSGEALISSLAMICAFAPNEKQALLEAPDLQSRAKLLLTLLEMACLPQSESESAKH